MAIKVKEQRRSRNRSRSPGNATQEREYMVWYEPRVATSAVDYFAIESALTAFLQGVTDSGSLTVSHATVTDQEAGTLTVSAYTQAPRDEHEQIFDCKVTWANQEGKPTLPAPQTSQSVDVSFEISYTNTNVTASQNRVGTFPSSAPNYPGIGWDSNARRFEGVDIQVPVFSWKETHYVPPAAALSLANLARAFNVACNPVNSQVFRGFGAGQVMYVGTQGCPRSADQYSLTHGFVASPNLSGGLIGTITGIVKAGWDYMWVSYQPDTLVTSGKTITIQKPIAAYVERVYNQCDFTGGISSNYQLILNPAPWGA